jgi:tetratricopeptide (TPR) repeat protein
MLLERGTVNRTRRHLEKLIELAPNSMSTLELLARVSARMGQEQQARAALGRALPAGGDLTKLTDEQLPVAEKIADLLAEELNDEETALKIYQYLVTRDPKKVLKLAEFVGRRRDVDESFKYLEQVYNPQVASAIVQVALSVIRERRDDVGSQFDKQIQDWIDGGLRENPYLISLQMQQAEFYDAQERYDEAAKAYRELLKRDDLQGMSRAIVLNNLSYLLALKGDASANEEAMRLVREAVTILGPQPDILDTRAVVFISQKQFEDAIADLELSVTDKPTASKYFHKAVAHLGANQNTDALFAWNEAVKLGLSRDSISPMEREQFERAEDQIEQLQTDSGDFDDEQPLGNTTRSDDFVTAGR